MKIKKYFIIIIFSFSIISFNKCSFSPENEIIIIKGSDTMLFLTKLLAEEYMKKNSFVSIYVEGGGTAAGIRSFVKGQADICMASRALKGEEVKLLADHFGSVGVSFIVAKDALTIFINPENPVHNFTLSQLREIFTGRIKNWDEIGGKDQLIKVIIRNPNSGTYLYFKEHVLNGDEYSPDAITKSTTQNIIDEVLLSENGISYGGIGYQQSLMNAKVEGISPTEENVRNEKYPVSRYLYFFTHNIPSGRKKDFIDWVMGPEGQYIVSKAGYISLWKY